MDNENKSRNLTVESEEEPTTAPAEKTSSSEENIAMASEAAESEDRVSIEDLAARLEELAAERDQLAASNQELEQRLLRRQADFENFRKRIEKERAEFFEYAGMETVRELLPILDDFERALRAASEGKTLDEEYVKGIGIIYQRLVDILKKQGLEPIESVGKVFDPNVHHAVDRVETEDVGEETVLEEWQKGYNFKGRLLREAMVRVAVKPSQPVESS